MPRPGRPGLRQCTAGLGAIGVPSIACVAHSLLATVLVSTEAIGALAVLAAALIGSPTVSARAFRLLRWIADRPEPAAPPRGGRQPHGAPH